MSDDEVSKWMGAFAYYLDKTPDVVPLTLYQLSPSSKPDKVDYRPLQSVCGRLPRTLELWCSGKSVRIVLGTESETPLRFFSQTYDRLRYWPLDESTREPGFLSNYNSFVGFDAELNHALPYTFWERDYKILDRLSVAISGPAWIQLVFVYYDWSLAAEYAGQGILSYFEAASRSPHPGMAGSTIGKLGGKIGGEFVEKAHTPGKFLHIRGLLPDPKELPPSAWSGDAIESVFHGLSVHFDDVHIFGYKGDQAEGVLNWLRSRNVPDPTKFIEMNAEIFKNVAEVGVPRWGHGREFIPGFPLTPEELTYFLSLPSEASLSRGGESEGKRGPKTTRRFRKRVGPPSSEEEIEKEIMKANERRVTILREMKKYAVRAGDLVGDKRIANETERFIRTLVEFGKKLKSFELGVAKLAISLDKKKEKEYMDFARGAFLDIPIHLFTHMRAGQKVVLAGLKYDYSPLDDVHEAYATDDARKMIRNVIIEFFNECAGKIGDKRVSAATKKLCRELLKFGRKYEVYCKSIRDLMAPPVEKERLESRNVTKEETRQIREVFKFFAFETVNTIEFLLTFALPGDRERIIEGIEDMLFRFKLLQR